MDVTGYDNTLVEFYHERVLRSLVLAGCLDLATSRKRQGTATVIAHGQDLGDGPRPYLATAAHVLPEPPNNSIVRLMKYNYDDPANPRLRIAEFESGKRNSTLRDGAYMKIGDRNNLGRFDIGVIRGSGICVDKKPWFTNENPQDECLPVAPEHQYCAEGTEVAWAGFPSIARKFTDEPIPCYFRGVVSSLVLRDEFQLYLIDGHNTLGMSGGPVWAYSSETKAVQVIAVISAYHGSGASYESQDQLDAQSNPPLPGLVVAIPIQSLLRRLLKEYSQLP